MMVHLLDKLSASGIELYQREILIWAVDYCSWISDLAEEETKA